MNRRIALLYIAVIGLAGCHKEHGEASSGLPLISPTASHQVVPVAPPAVQTSTATVQTNTGFGCGGFLEPACPPPQSYDWQYWQYQQALANGH